MAESAYVGMLTKRMVPFTGFGDFWECSRCVCYSGLSEMT